MGNGNTFYSNLNPWIRGPVHSATHDLMDGDVIISEILERASTVGGAVRSLRPEITDKEIQADVTQAAHIAGYPEERPESVPEPPAEPDLASMRKDDLVALAEERGVSSEGTKADIIERLAAPASAEV